MKYQGPGVEWRPEATEGTQDSETGEKKEKENKWKNVRERDLRCSCLMLSNFLNEIEGKFVVKHIIE